MRYYLTRLEWVKKEPLLFQASFWLKVLIFALMVFALAQPFSYTQKSNYHKKGRDIVLALDASGSMGQSGFDGTHTLKSKFESTLTLSKSFLQHRGDDNVGVVLFGTFAFSASPLTYDLNALLTMLDYTMVGQAGDNTALGDGLMQSLRVLSFGEAKQKVVVLISDGFHNAGKHSPAMALQELKTHGVRVYTIGLGKKGDFDMPLLKRIAKESNGKFFQASRAKELQAIYSEIDTLEPSPIRSEHYLNKHLLYPYFLALAFGLLLAWYIVQVRIESKEVTR